jgi:hypothetical protein
MIQGSNLITAGDADLAELPGISFLGTDASVARTLAVAGTNQI